MTLAQTQIAAGIDAILENIGKGDSAAEQAGYTGDEWAHGSAEWHLELAYSQLMTLAEALSLPNLRNDIAATYAKALSSGGGITDTEQTPDGDIYSKWAGPARRYTRTLQALFGTEPARTVTKDLESILRAATYSITDIAVFSAVPQDESVVHKRVEAVLRCLFPDLVHKPRLGKPIKNFEPDTGIPSLQTLIEYKFLADVKQVPKVADEILADTRGYHSKEWTSFLYALYETRRFRSEAEWRQLLRDCGVPDNATIVVMSGEPGPAKRRGRTPT